MSRQAGIDLPRFRFGALERRGVLAGLRPPQLVIVAVVGVLALAALRYQPGGAGLLLAVTVVLVGAVATFVPIVGRHVDEWFPVITGWLLRGARGRRRYRAEASHLASTEGPPALPAAMGAIDIIAHDLPGGAGQIGVVKDARAGTYTGVLAVRGESFALLDAAEKARRLSSWGTVLAGLAREGGLTHRVQWVERTVPDPGDEIGEHLRRGIAVPLESALARSYLQVIDDAAPVSQRHEVLIAVQVSAVRAASAIRGVGGGDRGACDVLRRELIALSNAFVGSDITLEGALTPRLLAHALRCAFDPPARRRLASIAAREPAREGTTAANAGPMACEEEWDHLHTDGGWHTTFWIAEWPRVDVGPDFLAPLLLRTETMRTVSLTMEPISPLKAMRSLESARTSAVADEELRNRAGFTTTTRRAREHDSLAVHEGELADGHAFYRFAGFITVTAGTKDDLLAARSEIEEAAARSLLDIRALSGEQAGAFAYTLPLCRGLR